MQSGRRKSRHGQCVDGGKDFQKTKVLSVECKIDVVMKVMSRWN